MKRVISASYGNDSIALIRYCADQGWTDTTVLFNDTGWSADGWLERVALAEHWAQSLGFRTSRTQASMLELLERKKAWPRGGGGKFQFCTKALKEEPALAWLQLNDPELDAVFTVGVRREESDNRSNFPEWTHESANHGGRDLHAPLVRHTEAMRNALIARSPFDVLPGRSKECYPCVNAQVGDLKWLPEARIQVIEAAELRAGINSKGNARVMFSPARHHGAVGIRAVVEAARHGSGLLFSAGCDSGWCGS